MIDNTQRDHISVCICTYRRPEMLGKAVRAVISQATYEKFTFEVVVVDNDYRRSAEHVVKGLQGNCSLIVIYDCEPEQNISLARNKAIMRASGNMIAFLDDDEIPIREWLLCLYLAMKEYNPDGVLGPVLPFCPENAPAWLKKAEIWDRPRYPSGTQLAVRRTRTGNVMLCRSVLEKDSVWFDRAYGRTGGEDIDFFRRQIKKGKIFVWCDEAVVYETIPPERWKAQFHIRKYLTLGTLYGERLRKRGIIGLLKVAQAIASVPVRVGLLLFFLPLGKHLWMRPTVKLFYTGGCVLAYCGISLMRYRDEFRGEY
jgi:succinoglycan biosynthesis protein ExoM